MGAVADRVMTHKLSRPGLCYQCSEDERLMRIVHITLKDLFDLGQLTAKFTPRQQDPLAVLRSNIQHAMATSAQIKMLGPAALRRRSLDMIWAILVPDPNDTSVHRQWWKAAVCSCSAQSTTQDVTDSELCDRCLGFMAFGSKKALEVIKTLRSHLTLHAKDVHCHRSTALTASKSTACSKCWKNIIRLLFRRTTKLLERATCLTHLTVLEAKVAQGNKVSDFNSGKTLNASHYQLSRMVEALIAVSQKSNKSEDNFPMLGCWYLILGKTLRIPSLSILNLPATPLDQPLFAKYEQMLCGKAPMLIQCLQLSAVVILQSAADSRLIPGFVWIHAPSEARSESIKIATRPFKACSLASLQHFFSSYKMTWTTLVVDGGGIKHWNLLIVSAELKTIIWYDPASIWSDDVRCAPTVADHIGTAVLQYQCVRVANPTQSLPNSCGKQVLEFILMYAGCKSLLGQDENFLPAFIAVAAATISMGKKNLTKKLMTNAKSQSHAESANCVPFGKIVDADELLMLCHALSLKSPALSLASPPFDVSNLDSLHCLIQLSIILSRDISSTPIVAARHLSKVTNLLGVGLGIDDTTQLIVAANLLQAGFRVITEEFSDGDLLARTSIARRCRFVPSYAFVLLASEGDQLHLYQWVSTRMMTTHLPSGVSWHGVRLPTWNSTKPFGVAPCRSGSIAGKGELI